MAIFTAGVNLQALVAQAQQRLINLRRALEDIEDFYKWTSAQSLADLEALGLSPADAQALQTAFADGNELAVLYNGGGLGAYTLPFNFSASQRQVIGPQ
jgi:hypothetical protein